LRICIHHDEVHAAQANFDHACYGIASAAAYADDSDLGEPISRIQVFHINPRFVELDFYLNFFLLPFYSFRKKPNHFPANRCVF
jgi:hypothetical protein